ncbi:MAG: sensor histidine kinase [Rhodocyclales bacterium GT-UBC]|nr:MAG: sensor histidine kinase [Rhodocyclales bacterium GT-UBC]
MKFRLVRHFSLTSLVLFAAIGSLLGLYYREMALSRMIRQQENNNVNLTRVFANTLWQRHFVDLLEEAGHTSSSNLKTLSRIPEIHRDVLALMRGSSTYKIKVYDLQGRTLYSSELAQIGEDKSQNPGFLGARDGQTRTELVHKEKFSAFEQVVENRDLIQSYIPQFANDGKRTAGVFEIYSDVTPLLAEIRDTEIRLLVMIVGAMGLLFTSLFLIVLRAERIIRRQAEENRQSQQQLAQAEKMGSLGLLVAGVSHQLNTPIAFSHSNVSLAISAIRNLELPMRIASRFAGVVRKLPADQHTIKLDLQKSRHLLSNYSAQPEDIEHLCLMLGDVLQGLEQMRELVDNLRDFTRLDRSKVVDTDINATLKTVIYIARSAIPSRVRISESFGQLPHIDCNPSQLNQVFLNLITNAAQAIEDSGEIRINTALQGSTIRIEVSDNGSGIPPEVLPHIFDTYFTTKPKGIGTGLGLSIARDIVRNHGGELSVATQAGFGTTFVVTLPVSAPETVMQL